MVASLLEISYTVITVGLLFYFLRYSLEKKFTLRRNIVWWILFGFVFNFYSFSWLYSVYPLIWMPEGVLQLLGIATLHLILSSVVSLCFFSVGYTLTKMDSIKKLYRPFVFATSLTLAEIFRSLVISLLYYGDNTTIDLHFTSGTIGNALSATPLIEFAYFGGTFALTFVLGYLVYVFTSKTHILQYWKHGVVIIVLLLYVHFFVPTYGAPHPVHVGVITTNFQIPKDTDISSYFILQNKKVDIMTASFVEIRPDIIVYPEDTRYIDYLPTQNKDNLSTLFKSTLFIDGSTVNINNKSANVSYFYNSETKKTIVRGKSLLLPFNEYIPYFFKPIFTLFITKDALEKYTAHHTYTPVYSRKILDFKDIKVGTLICSEILSYKTIQDVRRGDPSLVFFQSHLNVFHDNPWFRMHLYSFTKVAAAQLRRPLISSINGAPSLIISPHGKIIDVIPTGFSTRTYTFFK